MFRCRPRESTGSVPVHQILNVPAQSVSVFGVLNAPIFDDELVDVEQVPALQVLLRECRKNKCTYLEK